MSTLPRISGREVVAALAKLGYAFDRQRGSHMILRNPMIRYLLAAVLPPRSDSGTLQPTMVSGRIEVRPDVMLGKPVIRGTRITVELILRRMSEGATEEDLLQSYPHLTREDIRAAVAFAADEIAHLENLDLPESA